MQAKLIPVAGPWFFIPCSAEHLELTLTLQNTAGGSKHLLRLQSLIGLVRLFHGPKQPPSWPLLSRDAESFPLGRAAGRCSCTDRLLFSCPGGSLLLPAPSCKAGAES